MQVTAYNSITLPRTFFVDRPRIRIDGPYRARNSLVSDLGYIPLECSGCRTVNDVLRNGRISGVKMLHRFYDQNTLLQRINP